MFLKVLWFDIESFGLDPKVAGIRELAYVKELEGKQIGEIKGYKVQPILHVEDLLYGNQDITDFCTSYNKSLHLHDPDQLTMFNFKDENPLFFYAKSALTFNLPPPQILNPTDWLIGKDLISAHKALKLLINYLSEDDIKGRWILAGHNVSFDYNVLYWWSKRLLGEDSEELMGKINKFIFLDTLALSRWIIQYHKRIAIKANLGTIAEYLGVKTSNHTASADVFACKEIAKILLGMGEADGN